ncbi:hypothetical protein ACHAXR_001482, partial [Thalassiosira sp. AJA248-18]
SVICGRSNAEIDMLKKAYFKRYNKDLSNLISSELGGDIKKLALACLQGMEEDFDPTYHTESKAREDAKAFYKAGQGKRMGTDEAALFEIIRKSPHRFLKMIDTAKTIGDRIMHETSGDYEKLLLQIVNVAWPGTPQVGGEVVEQKPDVETEPNVVKLGCVMDGREVIVECQSNQGEYWTVLPQDRNKVGLETRNPTTFIVKEQCLPGQVVSLEDTGRPGHYICHHNPHPVIRCEEQRGTPQYAKSACFALVPALSGAEGFMSLKSLNDPQKYVRNHILKEKGHTQPQGRFWVEESDGTDA